MHSPFPPLGCHTSAQDADNSHPHTKLVLIRHLSLGLLVAVISLPGLYDEIFLPSRNLDLVITRLHSISSIWCVAKAVLIAQLLFDLGVDLIDCLFLGDFEQSSPCLL